MEFGIFCLMPRKDLARSGPRLIAEGLDQIVAAEQFGYDAVWLAEHHFSNYCVIPSPLHLAVAVAERTKRITIGTAVLVLPFYHGLRLAEDIALTDVLSGGRLRVGLGRGYQKYEFDRYGLSMEDSRSLFIENMEILRRALTQDSFSFEGKHYQIPETSLQLKPIQQPHPELWVAAHTRETIDYAVGHGHPMITTVSARPIEHASRVRQDYEDSLRAAGKSIETAKFGLQRYAFVANSRQEALEATRSVLWTYRIAEHSRNGTIKVDNGIAAHQTVEHEPTEEQLYERLIFGDPETCIQKLQKDIDTVRPTHFSFTMAIGDLPHERVLESMRRFREEVLPYVKAPAAPVA